jgi:hypothetical protein
MRVVKVLEKKNVWEEILKALKHFATIGKGLEKTLRDLQKHTTPFTPAFIVINDSEEEQVNDRTIKKTEQAQQPIEVE